MVKQGHWTAAESRSPETFRGMRDNNLATWSCAHYDGHQSGLQWAVETKAEK